MGYEGHSGCTADVIAVGGFVVVAAAGEVDSHTAPRLDAAVQQAVTRQPEQLIVDLSAVEFFDSSGMNVLVRALRQAGRVLVVAPRPVRRVVEVTGLSTVFTLFDDIDAAVADAATHTNG
ncbi:STAS domain-containing protein [Nocardia cerradoensis]|uniref:STAS domain-containing protein n=1 Tax=Nocardia cerradoensis TaxID=85688 RepID=UPI00031CFF46|nr:STAS domain-containing protein [Nocardia cerradoensis]